jgi:uncharacterized membrane protein YeiH
MRENHGVSSVTLTIPLWVDLFAVAIGSLQGAMFAAGFKRVDLLGVALIGITTGFGGGIVRDLLLGVTPLAFQSNAYIITAVVAVFVGMLLQRLLVRVDPIITIFDALTIGLFATIGTSKALALGLPVVPALLIGTLSAVGGSVLRDVLLNIPIGLMHVGSLYAVAALAGSGTYILMVTLNADPVVTLIVSISVTTLIRLLAVRFGWSLPEQRALSRLKLRKQREAEETIEAIRTQTIPIIRPEAEPPN